MGAYLDIKLSCESLDIKLEVYDRYADDQDIALRNFGRTVKFCPLAGEMVEKTEIEVAEEVDTTDDVLVMEELRKVADTDQRTGRDLPGGWIVGTKPKAGLELALNLAFLSPQHLEVS